MNLGKDNWRYTPLTIMSPALKRQYIGLPLNKGDYYGSYVGVYQFSVTDVLSGA